MTALTELPNIGKTLVAELNSIGVATTQELIALGSVEATRRIAKTRAGACHSLHLALMGPIRGVRWHSLPKSEGTRLTNRFDNARDR